MLVEMLGLPGSGKTTLARETCLALQGRGVPSSVVDEPISATVPWARRVRRRTGAAARATLRRPCWSLTSAARITSVRQRSGRDTASALLQWLAVCDLAGRARAGAGIHLLEEGPLQTLWTLGLRSPETVPARLLQAWPRAAAPDVVVVLDVPLEVIEARLRDRASKHSRSQQLPPDLLALELLRGRDLLAELSASTSVPVVRLLGSDRTTGVRLADQLVGVLVASAAGS